MLFFRSNHIGLFFPIVPCDKTIRYLIKGKWMPTKIMRIIKCFVMSTGDGGMSSARAVIILLLWRVQHKNVQYEESQSLSTTTEIYSTKLGLVEIFFDPKDVSRCNFVFCNNKKTLFSSMIVEKWCLLSFNYYYYDEICV